MRGFISNRRTFSCPFVVIKKEEKKMGGKRIVGSCIYLGLANEASELIFHAENFSHHRGFRFVFS